MDEDQYLEDDGPVAQPPDDAGVVSGGGECVRVVRTQLPVRVRALQYNISYTHKKDFTNYFFFRISKFCL